VLADLRAPGHRGDETVTQDVAEETWPRLPDGSLDRGGHACHRQRMVSTEDLLRAEFAAAAAAVGLNHEGVARSAGTAHSGRVDLAVFSEASSDLHVG